MKKQDTLYVCDLSGMAYVENSKGSAGNIHFFTGAHINTVDGTATPSYKVEVFRGKDDAYAETFADYSAAVDKYNELVTKFKPQ